MYVIKNLGHIPGAVEKVVVIFEYFLHIIVPLIEGAILCVLSKKGVVARWPRVCRKKRNI